VVIAALATWHEQHDRAAAALESVTALPAHVIVEAYAVLTCLPSGLAVSPTSAATVLEHRFADTPLRLDDAERSALLERLAAAGVFGGATYDGLVALEAEAHGRVLLTLDERGQVTYRRLGVRLDVIAA
jgi:toxin FitB